MTTTAGAFGDLPNGLRDPLLLEYRTLVQNYLEGRWSPAAMSGGRFCEIVYSILAGHAAGVYPLKPSKPKDMVSACRALEANKNEPRSFQILIPRLLPALYEVRNNRGAGHVGGDVDPNNMDATAVLSITKWIMAELVRVLHKLATTEEAQVVVDNLGSRIVPLVWEQAGIKRVLDTSLTLQDAILVLVASCPDNPLTSDLRSWTGYANKGYFTRLLRSMHQGRLINVFDGGTHVTILPPGTARVEELLRKRSA